MTKEKQRNFPFLLFIFAFTCFCMLFINKGSDYFWHIKAGEIMWKEGKILTEDIFSFLSIGKHLPWISHEWLQEIILEGFKKISSQFHIFLYCFIFLFFLFWILYKTNQQGFQKNLPFSIFFLSLSLVSFGNLAMPRPMMISNTFLALTLFLLYDLYRNENSKKIYLLPLLSLLWANIHGGCSNLSYLLALLFGVVSCFSCSFHKIACTKKTKRQRLLFFGIAILSFLFIAINPHGIKMWFYPYQNMGNTYMLQTIREWAPTTLTNPMHLPFFFLLFFVSYILLKSKKKIKAIDFFLFLIFTYLGLKSVRFWGYLYLASTYFIFNYITPIKRQTHSTTLLIIFSIFLIGLAFLSFPSIKEELMQVPLSEEMIKKIKVENPTRLYNFYDDGGYLIYCGIFVFIDGRADFYSDINTYKDYFQITNLEPGFQKPFQKYAFDYFLVSKKTKLYHYLKKQNYPLLLEEKDRALFKAIH